MAGDNSPRWDGSRRGFYEVWYLTLNHRQTRTGFWICYTLDAPVAAGSDPFAQVWFAFFDAGAPELNFAIRRTAPIASLRLEAEPFGFAIDGAHLTGDRATGSIDGDGHRARWSLGWPPAARGHRHLPPVLYRGGGLAETTVTGPNLDVAMSGVIEADGRHFELTGEPGNQSHLWGRAHAHRWAWGHCSAFEGRPGAVLETLTVRLARAGRELPPMTVLTLYLDGEVFCWNRFLHMPATRGRTRGTTSYHVGAWRPDLKLRGELRARPQDMVATAYFDPQGGPPSWCHNTEVADVELTVWRRGRLGRWREAARLIGSHSGHFEVGQPSRDPAIVREHVHVGS